MANRNNNLKHWLKANKRTQTWLAWKAKTDDGQLSKIIRGYKQPTPDLNKRIKRVTGIDLLAVEQPAELTEAR